MTHQCTSENPWDASRPVPPGDRVEHKDALETGREDFGDGLFYQIEMRCPNCGQTWWKEGPQ